MPDPTIPYAEFVVEPQYQALAGRIADRYRAVHGFGPAGSDIRHNLWRVLTEGYTEQEMLDAIGPSPGPIEPPPPVEPGPLPNLRIDGRVWRDGDRLWVPHFTELLSALRPDRTEDDWRRYFDRVLTFAPYNGCRVFAGALTWAGQTAASARARLPRFLDVCTEYGLVVEVSALTDSGSGYDTEEHLREISEITAGRTVIIELANEVGHPTQAPHVTPSWLREAGQRRFPFHLWAVGSTGDELAAPPASDYAGHGGPYMTGHLDRGRDLLNQIRRVKELAEVGWTYDAPVLDNERLGSDETNRPGARTNQPWFFYAAGALDRAFAIGGVHHSQAGLVAGWRVIGPVQEACARAEAAGQRDAAFVLGDAVGDYQNAGHANSPITNPGGSEAFEDRGDHGGEPGPFIRAYSLVAGAVALTVALHRPVEFPEGILEWGNGWTRDRIVGAMDHVTLLRSTR